MEAGCGGCPGQGPPKLLRQPRRIESPPLPDADRFSYGPRRFNKRCLAQSDSRRPLAGTTATPRVHFMFLYGLRILNFLGSQIAFFSPFWWEGLTKCGVRPFFVRTAQPVWRQCGNPPRAECRPCRHRQGWARPSPEQCSETRSCSSVPGRERSCRSPNYNPS